MDNLQMADNSQVSEKKAEGSVNLLIFYGKFKLFFLYTLIKNLTKCDLG